MRVALLIGGCIARVLSRGIFVLAGTTSWKTTIVAKRFVVEVNLAPHYTCVDDRTPLVQELA